MFHWLLDPYHLAQCLTHESLQLLLNESKNTYLLKIHITKEFVSSGRFLPLVCYVKIELVFEIWM